MIKYNIKILFNFLNIFYNIISNDLNVKNMKIKLIIYIK